MSINYDALDSVEIGAGGAPLGKRKDRGENLHVQDGELHLAVAAGDEAKVRALALSCDKAALGRAGRTGLHMAAAGGQARIVRLLLDAGHNPEMLDEMGETPLMSAVREGQVSTAVEMLSNGSSVNAKGRLFAETALHLAAVRGLSEMTQILLRAGADPNVKDSQGQTAAHCAAKDGAAECLDEILQAGGDPGAQDNGGRTPLHLAVAGNRLDHAKLLLRDGAPMGLPDAAGLDPLHEAARSGALACLSMLLELGASQTNLDGNERTALVAALEASQGECAAALVAAGSSLSFKRRDGQSALAVAAGRGRAVLDKVLAAAGSDLLMEFMTAVRDGRDDDARALMRAGVRPGDKAANGLCAMHVACSKGRADLAAQFLEFGVKVDEPGPSGRTPLMYAASGGHESVCKMLLDAGADHKARDAKGKRALDYAEEALAEAGGSGDQKLAIGTRRCARLLSDRQGAASKVLGKLFGK